MLTSYSQQLKTLIQFSLEVMVALITGIGYELVYKI